MKKAAFFKPHWLRLALASSLVVLTLPVSAQELVLYSGRSKALVEPLIERFEEETGIQVRARFGGTSQLSIALQEEGARSRADLFWAQDAGALGSVGEWLRPLPNSAFAGIPSRGPRTGADWVATSGRARVLAFSPSRVDTEDIPDTLAGLHEAKWRGRVGWAPTNGSFQAFVTAMRQLVGEQATRSWLEQMRNNDAQAYPNNSSLLQAIAAGEIDLAITNHYYLYRFKERDPEFPVAQTFFADGSPGNLVNYAGLGMLATSRNTEPAAAFVRFILSPEAQAYFTEEVFEYPVRDDIDPLPGMADFESLQDISPAIDLDVLEDLDGTIRLLREVNLL